MIHEAFVSELCIQLHPDSALKFQGCLSLSNSLALSLGLMALLVYL